VSDGTVRVFRKVAHVLIRSVAGILIGATGVSLLWIGWLFSHGKSVGEAMNGEVEDAIGLLQGLLALATFVGAPVGFLWGIATLPRQSAR
jgi:hypothetical protein